MQFENDSILTSLALRVIWTIGQCRVLDVIAIQADICNERCQRQYLKRKEEYMTEHEHDVNACNWHWHRLNRCFLRVDRVLPQLIHNSFGYCPGGRCSKECFPSLSAEPNWTQLQDNNWKWKVSTEPIPQPDIVHHQQYSHNHGTFSSPTLEATLPYHISVMVKCAHCEQLLFSSFFSILLEKKTNHFNGLIFSTAGWNGFLFVFFFFCFKDPNEPIYYEPDCVYQETVCKYLVHSGLVPPRKLIIYLFIRYFLLMYSKQMFAM